MNVLVFGAGQLARMMFLEAAPLGIDLKAVDVSNNNVVDPIDKRPYDVTLEQAIDAADVVTVEFEHVPLNLLKQADEAGKLKPNLSSILAGADRIKEKALLQKADIASSPFEVIRQPDDIYNVPQSLGEQVIYKASRDGYDGYGQWRMKNASELDRLRNIFAKLDLKRNPVLAEKMIKFDREISIIGARSSSGDIKCFEIAENLHHDGQLHVSVAPATFLSDSLKRSAYQIFEILAQTMDHVGVLAVELFQMGEQLLVNEIAPRVHNSGHWTQQGCQTNQFEQHIRATLGLPLGSTVSNSCNAMVNIIGFEPFSKDLMSLEGIHFHWYGKEVRSKRKMGHINVVADSHVELGNKLNALSNYLPLQHFPLLKQEAERLILS